MILTNCVIAASALVLLKLCASAWLDLLNAKSVKLNSERVPDAFREIIDDASYFKSVKYTLEKIRFGLYEDAYSSILLIAVLAFGIYPKLFYFFENAMGKSVWAQAASICFISAILGLANLPFEWHSQFKIEHKYGFNKSTLSLWISDQFKELAIGLVIGIPMLALLLWLFGVFQNTWWLWGFGAVAVFQIAMLIIYPRVIMPLFNKLSPLEHGELKTRLLKMSDHAGFHASSIYVIDGSKRSSHSNAFFTGFGKFRRIVLFDTLIEQLDPEEIEAVLAHEIGHYRKGHVPKMILSSFAMIFLGFAAIAYLSKCPWFFSGFGFKIEDGMAPIMLLFSSLIGLFTFWLNPIFNCFSRKYEYQADKFAKDVCGGGDSLISALRKLHTKNLGNLTPHKIYSAFHYSHPTLLERESALKNGNAPSQN